MVNKGQITSRNGLILSVPGIGPLITILALFSFFINILILAMPIYTLQLFDRVLGSRSVDTLVLLSVAVGIAIVMQVAIDAARSRILQRLAARFESYYMDQVVEATLLQSARIGTATAQPMRDLGEIKNSISSPMVLSVLDMPWVPLFLFATFVLHPYIGYLTLCGMIFLFVMAIFHAWYVNRTNKSLNDQAIQAFENMQDFADHADAIVAMGMRDNVSFSWQQNAHEALKKQVILGQNSSAVQSVSKFVRMGLQVAVMGIGCFLVLGLELSAGAMIAASIIMARALAPAEQAISSWKIYSSAREAHRRLSEVLSQNPLVRPQIVAEDARGYLQLDEVTFTREGLSDPIIKSISTHVEPGSIVGIIGASGSGKSTLARLIVGVLAPTKGSVRLDGIDVTQRAVFDLGKYIGYLPQDVQLFHGTVRENIARLSNAKSDTIRNAAKLAGVEDLINRLPKGYDTVIGGSGVRLSGGQRQRIGLARAVFDMPRLVVLDEPDASLDPEGVQTLIDAIQALKNAGCAVVVVSHRPPMLTLSDRLLLIKDGRLEADDVRDEVLKSLGVTMAVKGPEPAQLESKEHTEEDQNSDTENGSGKDQDTDSGVVPITVANWSNDIQAKWQAAHKQGALPKEDEARRMWAVTLGYWLAIRENLKKDGDDDALPGPTDVVAAMEASELDTGDIEKSDLVVSVLGALGFQEDTTSIQSLAAERSKNKKQAAK